MLLRQRSLLLNPSVKCGVFMGVAACLERLNAAPLSWMSYDTATAVTVHSAELVVGTVSSLLSTTLFATVIFAVAEGLGRLAYAGHTQLFRSTSWDTAASQPHAYT